MAVPRLVPYIRKQLAAGYSINQIKDFLIKNNYNPNEVNKAVSYVSRKKPKIPWTIVIAGILGVIALILVFLFFIGGGEDAEIEQATDVIEQEERIIPGEMEEEEEIVETEQEEAKIEEVGEEEVELIELECPESCDDGNKCTVDKCSKETNYVCAHEVRRMCCGNNICEPQENSDNCALDCREPVKLEKPKTVTSVTEEAKEIAEKSLGRAAAYCSDIERETLRDSCYFTIAKEGKQSAYCDEINSELKRDSCYINAATQWQDFSVCDKITDEYLRTSCLRYAESF